jgi:hypothetical protein
MANAWRNTTLILQWAMQGMLNNFVLAAKCDRQVDEKNLFRGDIGETAYAKRPIKFTASDDPVITEGDITAVEEATVPVTLNYYKKVVFKLTQKERSYNMLQTYKYLLEPAMEQIAQEVESSIAANSIYLANHIGTPGTTPSTMAAVVAQNTRMSNLGIPNQGKRNAFYSPTTKGSLADGLKSVFPEKIAKEAIEEANFGRYGGLNSYECQSLRNHTVGVNTGTPLINGANQDVTYLASKNTQTQSLITDGWTNSQTGILKAGDKFTIADVYAVNDGSKESTGELQNFTVTADADSGASTGPATFTISPPIITSGPYQNCDAAPADGAAITVLTGTGGTSYKHNMFFHPSAISLVFGRLEEMEKGTGVVSERYTHKGVSMCLNRGSDISLKSTIYSLDCHWGVKVMNPLYGGVLTE